MALIDFPGQAHRFEADGAIRSSAVRRANNGSFEGHVAFSKRAIIN